MIRVTKQNGEVEAFDERKLERGLKRAGASREVIEQVKRAVRKEIYDGISTREIFAVAFREFRKTEPVTANRYNIKDALMRLGSSGFPFEMFIERILTLQGYRCVRDEMMQGKIITHEIDVDAVKGTERLMVECKHRSKPWISTHIQTALYVYARFLDVKAAFTRPMLVTNTKFSPQVIEYAKGVGMRLMGWHFPKEDSLERNIDVFNAYPVTLLPSMTDEMLEICLRKGYVMLSDIHGLDEGALSKLFGITRRKAAGIVQACTLCNQHLSH